MQFKPDHILTTLGISYAFIFLMYCVWCLHDVSLDNNRVDALKIEKSYYSDTDARTEAE